jgi:hypothetical protein
MLKSMSKAGFTGQKQTQPSVMVNPPYGFGSSGTRYRTPLP